MKVISKGGQTLADLAVQEYGSWEGAIALAVENGMSITDVPSAGEALSIPDATYNKMMQNYCKANDVCPATERDESGIRLKIFQEEFTEEFE